MISLVCRQIISKSSLCSVIYVAINGELVGANQLPNCVILGNIKFSSLPKVNNTYLLEQIQQVPVAEYKTQCCRLALAQAPRQQKCRLHRHPVSTIQALVNQHTVKHSQTCLTL